MFGLSFFSVAINNTLLLNVESQFVTDGTATNTGFLDISQWSGQSVQLFLGLNASDNNNLGGTITVDNIAFAAVPEPSSLCLMLVIGLCLIMTPSVGRRLLRPRPYVRDK